MNHIFVLKDNSFSLFIEKATPILILGTIFLIIFDKFIVFEFKDAMYLYLIVIIALLRGIYFLFNNKCSVSITDESLTILKGNNYSKCYKFEDVELLSYLYYGVYNIQLKNGDKEKIKFNNELVKTEKSYIDINVVLYNILKEKFYCHYTDDLILYAQNYVYPNYLLKYDKMIKIKRIIATVLYILFSVPIIIMFLLNLFFALLSII